jgi:hypothetical protein
MPPFQSFAHALGLLARRARRRLARAGEPGATGREIALYRGAVGVDRGRAGPATARGGAARAALVRAGPGVGGLLAIAVLSFGVVLAGATVLCVLRGWPTTRAGPAPVDHRGAGAPAERAGPASTGTPAGGEGSARTPGPRPGGSAGGAGDHGPGGSLAGSGTPSDAGSGGDPAGSAAARARAELPGRLDEILRVREAALARRDPGLLATIYTVDCACLHSGGEVIARLRADHAVWRGRSVSVRVERLSRVSDSLWIVLAVLRRSAFRIEGEDGSLVSAEPAARQRYRFALALTPAGMWLLGHASLVEELSP